MEIKEALTNNGSYFTPRKDLLVGGETVWVGEVDVQKQYLDENLKSFDSRNIQLSLSVLKKMEQDIEQIKTKFASHRIGIVVGTSTSGIADNEPLIQEAIKMGHLAENWVYSRQEVAMSAEMIKWVLKLSGPCHAVFTACSSGAKVFATAMRWLHADICDAVIVGGVDTLCQFTLNGFSCLESLSKGICQPFSPHRDGINIG